MAGQTLDDIVAAITARVAGGALEELPEILHAALAELGPLLDVERAYLVAVLTPTGRVVLGDEWCVEGAVAALSTVLSMGASASEEKIRRRLSSLGVKTVLMVPARPAGSLTGTIFVATSKRNYRPDMSVMVTLQAVVDVFVGRLVGVLAEHGALSMRKQLGAADDGE